MGTPNHTNLAPFSDISGMSSGAGDLLSASVGLGNGASLLNGNSIFCRLEVVKFIQVICWEYGYKSYNFCLLKTGHCNGLSSNGFGGSLEDLNKMLNSGSNCSGLARKSQNMTECVPVPTSEHVAEIVGRQGKTSQLHFLNSGFGQIFCDGKYM